MPYPGRLGKAFVGGGGGGDLCPTLGDACIYNASSVNGLPGVCLAVKNFYVCIHIYSIPSAYMIFGWLQIHDATFIAITALAG